MDGAAFERTSYAARFERNLPGAWDTVQANVYYNEADHVMDNYTLRTPNPNSMMPMPMASNVDRRTQAAGSVPVALAGRAAGGGCGRRDSRHRGRMGMGRAPIARRPGRPMPLPPLWRVHRVDLSAGTDQRWISGLRIDRASVRDGGSRSAE
jgi:iron complex outermembrane receptor protein